MASQITSPDEGSISDYTAVFNCPHPVAYCKELSNGQPQFGYFRLQNAYLTNLCAKFHPYKGSI